MSKKRYYYSKEEMIKHLNTSFGVVIHFHISFQKADFAVDTFYYNVLGSSLKYKIF